MYTDVIRMLCFDVPWLARVPKRTITNYVSHGRDFVPFRS